MDNTANMKEDFEKGFENGLENLDKSNYQDFLHNEVDLEWLLQRKTQLETKNTELETKIDDTKKSRIEILEEVQKIQHQYDTQSHQITVLENEISAYEDHISEKKEEKAKLPLNYPLIAGIIYLAAGIVFMLGDLIISHEIVAYALNIKNNVEAWAFAAGLAGVTLLIKPAYERLVEEPYHSNPSPKTKKIHGYFQTSLVVISILTLSILGWFRYEAYKVDKLKESLNTEIRSLQLSSTSIIGEKSVSNPLVERQIEGKMKELKTLNQSLVNSPWALLSFVLSGVLFAIAGAICFGIAFPVLSSYWRRWFWQNAAINKSKRRINRRKKKLAVLKKPWFEHASVLELQKEKLVLLPDWNSLNAELETNRTELQKIAEQAKLAQQASRTSIFNSGYDSGLASQEHFDGDEMKNLKKGILESIKTPSEKTSKVYKTHGLRPYQTLRKAISEGFHDN